MTDAAPPSSTNVCALIVTFNPDPVRLGQILAVLADDVACTVIVDNGSAQFSADALHSCLPNLLLKRLPQNAGIAVAQNEGIALARGRGYGYVLLLDHDSVPEAGMVRHLAAAMTRLQTQAVKVCCVGPRLRSRHDGQLNQFTRLGWWRVRIEPCQHAESVVEVDFLISSGSLIPMAAFDDVGVLEARLFIDQVDSEWCMRARAKGWRIFGACGAVLEHGLGEYWGRMWLGRWRYQPRHKPFRYYYIFRNTILVCCRGYVPMQFRIFNLKWLTLLFLMWGVFARDRQGELAMMLKGVWHALRGITGKMPARS
jgi:rhamnosyltransferase